MNQREKELYLREYSLLKAQKPSTRMLDLRLTETWKSEVGSDVIPYQGVAAHRKWVEANMRDLMPEAPEVIAGETVFDSIAHPQEQTKDRQQALFVVVRTYHGLPGQAETMHSALSQHTLPAVTDAPGFRGFYAFRDEDEPDRAVSVSLFDNREDATRSHERVVGTVRGELGEMAYDTPEVTMGETVVLATA